MPRFSIANLMLATIVVAMLCVANLRESRTLSPPYYAPLLGAVWHPPPYVMKEMAIDVHDDRGWPLWHTRRSRSFAAQNVGLYVQEDHSGIETAKETDIDFDVVTGIGVAGMDSAPLQTNWIRAGLNLIAAIIIVAFVVVFFEVVYRRIRAIERNRLIASDDEVAGL